MLGLDPIADHARSGADRSDAARRWRLPVGPRGEMLNLVAAYAANPLTHNG
ncbi:hypothetical protein I552_0032 [Mycobacterium xenopi 3993]|nr:hypothetical protein I552_0032 [Mycobacterium xenopi 3993]